MSLKLGGSKSKTSETSTSSFNNSTTAIVPDWARSLTEGVAGRVGELNRLDPHSLFAPAHALQQQAAGQAAGLSGMGEAFTRGGELMRGAAEADAHTYQPGELTGATLGRHTEAASHSLLDNLDAYMSPYRKQVVDAALADFDFGAGQTRAQQDLELAGSGAFGGSGAALTRAATEDALVRGRATTSANLLDQMFGRGAALSSEDAGRRQQASLANAGWANDFARSRADLAQRTAEGAFAAGNEAARYNAGAEEQALQRRMEAGRGIGDLASAYEANQRANIGAEAELGETLRGIEQQQRQAPITHAQQIVAMLNGLPISLFTGEQKTGTETSSGTSTRKGTDWGASATFTKIPGISG